MNQEEIDQLKVLIEKLWRWLDQIDLKDNHNSTLNAINSNMLRLLYSDKDTFTLKEISKRANIPVKKLYQYEKDGILKTIEQKGLVKMVMQEDLINFLKYLRDN